MKKFTKKDIQDLLSSKTLKIKALTSAGIITGIVVDIFDNSSKNIDVLNNSEITITQNSLIYVIEKTNLYPVSNIQKNIFLDRIELDSSKIIALCPLFEEAD